MYADDLPIVKLMNESKTNDVADSAIFIKYYASTVESFKNASERPAHRCLSNHARHSESDGQHQDRITDKAE